MKVLLLTEHGGTVEEYPCWPDDLSEADVKKMALQALENFYDTSGERLVPKGALQVPRAIRVLANDGEQLHHWTVVDLAKSLGKAWP